MQYNCTLGLVNVDNWPAGLEPPAGAINRRWATVKIRRNPILHFFPHDPNSFLFLDAEVDANKGISGLAGYARFRDQDANIIYDVEEER